MLSFLVCKMKEIHYFQNAFHRPYGSEDVTMFPSGETGWGDFLLPCLLQDRAISRLFAIAGLGIRLHLVTEIFTKNVWEPLVSVISASLCSPELDRRTAASH